ncbi:MAG: Bug family tripartite tricarboxylate transporter substrate binding protein [Planctomycetaceae bacterium]
MIARPGFARSIVALGVLLFVGCSAEPAAPREFPNRPIRLIVPFNAGGGTDAYARVMVKAIEDHRLLPEPVVVVNVGGAGATIGSRKVKNARPDGHTILILHDAILTAKLSGTANYGPDAFQPIAGTGEQGMVIAVRDDSPYESLNDLLGDAKRRPSSIVFGANLGALTHYAGLLLENESGAKFVFTQLGGGSDRFAKLIGGHIDVTGFSTEEFVRFKPRGLRGLALFSQRRHDAIPSVPTAQEQHVDIVLSNTFYWWTPKETPKRRIAVLADALRKAVNTPEVRRRLIAMHCRPIFVRGDELQQRIDRSAAVYGRVSPEPPDLPDFVAIVFATITLLVVLRLWLWRRGWGRDVLPASAVADDVADALRPRVWSAVSVVALCFLYFGLLAWQWLPFPAATLLFVTASGGLLVRWSARTLLTLAALAMVTAFGLHMVLIRVFDVDFSS